VTFNEDNQPIGLTNKVLFDLRLFLGTLAMNSTFCPTLHQLVITQYIYGDMLMYACVLMNLNV